MEYAVDRANYIYNKISYSGIHNIHNKIPHEILFKSKVDYSHFKVFGGRIFFYFPKFLQNKFDNNALPSIFLGYHPYSSAYKILNLSSNKINLSRSGDFFENNPGNSKITSSIPMIFFYFIPNPEIRGSDILSNNDSKRSNYYNFFNNNNNNNNNYNNYNTKNEVINTIYNNSINDKIQKLTNYKSSTSKTHNNTNLKEPKDFNDIFNLPDKDEWLDAVYKEQENIEQL